MSAQWHPDPDLLAEMAEDLTDAATVARVEAHLADCAECRSLRARLKLVTEVLQRQPAPPIPENVAARVMAALAAEPMPTNDASAPDVSDSATVGVRDLDPARSGRGRRRWLRQGLAAAAAVAAIVGIGTVGVAVFRSSEVGTSATYESAPGGPAAAPVPPQPASAPHLLTSGRTYTQGNLKATVSQLLARTPAFSDKSASDRTASPPSERALGTPEGDSQDQALSRLRDQTVMAGCLATLTAGRVSAPLVVDLATYEGRPAAIVIVPSPTPGRVDVFVVGPNCSSTTSDLIIATSVPR